jgi:hypothetical protein
MDDHTLDPKADIRRIEVISRTGRQRRIFGYRTLPRMQMRDRLSLAALIVAVCGGVVGCGECSPPHGTTTPPPSHAGPVIGTLRVDPVNPRYFTAGNGAVYLTGSHTWGNFKDRAKVDPPPAFDYAAFLDFLVAHRHNFFRLWTWEQPHSADDDPAHPLYFTPFAWPRTGTAMASDGKPQFDLDQLDQAYFDRMRGRVIAARDRGIYVSIMLFEGWDLTNGYNDAGGFPMASGNNVNGVATAAAEFLSLSNPAITARQEAYVRKVIDTVNDLDNVLYEIANETGEATAAIAWQYHMVDLVKSVEKSMPKQHPVGMTSTYPGSETDLYASNADWISPNTRLSPSDGRKVVLNDTDHSYGWVQLKSDGPAAQRAWAWETLCIGAAPLFMDPYLETWAGRNSPSGSTPDPRWNTIRNALGYTALYASRLDLERAVPSPMLCSTGYCLAEPGHQYLVYQPASGSFQLLVAAGSYHGEWFDPTTGQATDGGMMTLAAGQRSFMPPASFTGDAVLLLLAQ